MKKFLLSIFAVLFAFASVQAQSELVYTLTPVTGSNNSYAGNCDIIIDGITWNLTGNSTTNPWRMGGKSITKVDRALYSKTPINATVDKVTITMGETSGSITVNSAKLLISSTPDFTNFVEKTFTGAAKESYDITLDAVADSYFKLVFNLTVSGNNNKYISVSEIKFYGTKGEGGETEPETPVVPDEPETPGDGSSWSLVEYVSDLNIGDEIIIACDSYGLGTKSNTNTVYHTKVNIKTSNDRKALTDIGEAKILTVGKNGDKFTFSYDGNYLFWSSGNSLATSTTVSVNSSWTITIKDGVATISNSKDSTRKLQYNASSPRFACYTGTQQDVRIYKKIEASPKSYTLAVTDAGYATLFLDFPATIPAFNGEDAGAYIVKGVKDGNWLNLVKVEDVLPANTGIIVKADGGSYEFKYSADEATDVAGNLLEGSVVDKDVEGEAYVLGYAEGTTDVVFAKANMNGTSWKNNAHKAYLPVAKLTAGSDAPYYSLRFEDGTTAIENVEVENEVKAIFDLTGRRVEEITAPGIYIVNGKKVLVK